jgi:hypothetical protein
MYFKILSVIAIIEIAWGTIFSVLGIIKMSFEDVVATQSCNAFNSMHESNLLQRYYARCGIAYIVAGSLLQIYLTFINPDMRCEFLTLLIAVITIPTAVYIVERDRYNDELIKIREKKEKDKNKSASNNEKTEKKDDHSK